MNKALERILHVNTLRLELTPKVSGKVNNKPYLYNTLADVQELLMPVLDEIDVNLLQDVSSTLEALTVTTTVFFDDETYVTVYTVPHTNINGLTLSQSDTSTSTNARKTVLKSLFGIISKETMEDNDGQGEEIKAKQKTILVKGSKEEREVIAKLDSGEITKDQVMAKYSIDEARFTVLSMGF